MGFLSAVGSALLKRQSDEEEGKPLLAQLLQRRAPASPAPIPGTVPGMSALSSGPKDPTSTGGKFLRGIESAGVGVLSGPNAVPAAEQFYRGGGGPGLGVMDDGGPVPESGPYNLEEGEYVVPRRAAGAAVPALQALERNPGELRGMFMPPASKTSENGAPPPAASAAAPAALPPIAPGPAASRYTQDLAQTQPTAEEKAAAHVPRTIGQKLLRGVEAAGVGILTPNDRIGAARDFYNESSEKAEGLRVKQLEQDKTAAGIERQQQLDTRQNTIDQSEIDEHEAVAAKDRRDPKDKLQRILIDDGQGNPVPATYDLETHETIGADGMPVQNPTAWEKPKAAPAPGPKLTELKPDILAQVGQQPTTPEYDGKKYPTVEAAQAAWGAAYDEKEKKSTLSSTQQDVEDTAHAIAEGQASPVLTEYSFRDRTAIEGQLKRLGYNQAQAESDWKATQKLLSTLNGPQQVRLRQAISFTSDSLPIIEKLFKEWKETSIHASGFKALNKAALAADEQLSGQAGAAAHLLSAQIADLTSELGTVYKGGNSSTDESLKLAGANLEGDWNEQTFTRAVQQIRTNLQIRKNSIDTSRPEGVSSGSQYAPSGESSGMVTMRAPNGQIKPVPADQVDHYKKLGAVVQ